MITHIGKQSPFVCQTVGVNNAYAHDGRTIAVANMYPPACTRGNNQIPFPVWPIYTKQIVDI